MQIAVYETTPRGAGGAELVLKPDDIVRPDTRVMRVRGEGQGATVVLVRRSGGVLFIGDLDLASDGAKQLLALGFSSVLSSKRAPIWNAGRDRLLQLQDELPKPRKQFGILLPPPWDRAYKGRLEDKMYHHDIIVPKDDTAARDAAMGPETLVVASATREARNARSGPCRTVARPTAMAPPRRRRLRGTARAEATAEPFAEDWRATSTPSDRRRRSQSAHRHRRRGRAGSSPARWGARFRRVPIEEPGRSPYVDYVGVA